MNKINVSRCLALLVCVWSGAAIADVVVVVSAQSKVSRMSHEQVADLFLGKSKELPDAAGPALLISTAGPVRDEFYSKVLGKEPAQVKATWARLIFSGKGIPPRELADSAEVKKLLAANPSTVGFLDKAEVDSTLRVVYAP